MKKILTLILICFIFSANAQTGMLNGTGYAPDISVSDINGNTHNLYSYLNSDKVVVLELMSTTCGHCQQYAAGTQNSYQAYGPNGLDVAEFIALEVNTATSDNDLANFATTYGVSFPMCNGISPTAINYQLYYTPSYYVIYPDSSYVTFCPAYCQTTSSFSTIENLLNTAIQTWLPPLYGCTDPLATNYDSTATHNDGSCNYTSYTIKTIGSTFSPDTIICDVGDTINYILGGYHNAVEVSNSTWLAGGSTSNGGFSFGYGATGQFIPTNAQTYYYVCQPHVTSGMKGVIIANALPISGCTDSLALNYDPAAIIDDSSCLYCNYNVVDTLSYTGAMQTFTVPASVTSVTIQAYGAQGRYASLDGSLGGKGGYAKGDLSVTPGQVLNIYVGGEGTVNPTGNIGQCFGGFNGGGNGGNGIEGGSGGGASDVRVFGNSLSNRVIVAAGGGGADQGIGNKDGGDGGGLVGNDGNGNPINATGGTQSSGGIGANYYSSHIGTNGVLGIGGDNCIFTFYSIWSYGGGGGGGYYGGGGGTPYNAGAGGSSYIAGVTNSSTTPGVQTGNGSVIISYSTQLCGCTDPTAVNYGSFALYDDGSCCYASGCNDPVANNYDPLACFDDLCTYNYGCTDSLAHNFDPAATMDDGSCIFLGCTDPLANNYDPTSTINDSSCTYNCIAYPITGLGVTSVIHDRITLTFDNMNTYHPFAGVQVCRVDQIRIKYRQVNSLTTWNQKNMAAPTGYDAITGICNSTNKTDKLILGLTGLTTYEWKMKVWYCTTGYTAWVDGPDFTTLGECPNVGNLVVTPGSTTQATFTWDDSNGSYEFVRIKMRVDSITNPQGSDWFNVGGFGVTYGTFTKNKNGLVSGESYRGQARTWCDPSGGAYRSTTWTAPIFWTQPNAIRLEGGTAINNLTIFPNPSRDIFNVSFTSDTKQDLKVRIMNVIGEELVNENLEQFIGEYTKQINLNDNAKGVYFLEITTNDGIINKKLILQ